jgi:hypothetical protein
MELAKTLPSLKYNEVFPELKTQASESRQPLFTLKHEPNETTYSHIGFLSFNHYPQEYSSEAVAALKLILQKIMQEARVKKVELFTCNPIVIQICQQAGFFVRGEKIASHCENGSYQNELGLEYSFFTLEDAKKLIFSQINDANRKDTIENALLQCKNTINRLEANEVCDSLGSRYLENLIYQMVRDELGAQNSFSLTEKNWQPLLNSVPHALWLDIEDLHQRLHNHSFRFFSKPSLLVISNTQTIAQVGTTPQAQCLI